MSARKPFCNRTPEELDTMRASWREWSATRDEQERQAQAERAARRAKARREARTALVVTTRPPENVTTEDDWPIYAIELLRRYGKDLAALPLDWRLPRPVLKTGNLLAEQPEHQHPDARAVEQRLAVLRQLLPRELDTALHAILHGLELRAQAREAAAFQLGYAAGHERTKHQQTNDSAAAAVAPSLPARDYQHRRTEAQRRAQTALRLTIDDTDQQTNERRKGGE